MLSNDFLNNDWHVVARSQDLQAGKILKARLLGEDLVLWRNGDQALAWQDRCPHRGASLAGGWIKEDNLVCPYHGFAFNDSGQCVHVPAHPVKPPSPLSRACVRTFHALERYEMIWVCMGTPQQDVPPLPEWDHPNYYKFFDGPSLCRASAPRALENFFDVNHVPFVHKGTVGNPNYASIDDYEVVVKSDGIHISNVNITENNPRIPGEVQSYNIGFHISRPLTACLRRAPNQEPMILFYTITPVDQEECLIWRWTFGNRAIPEQVFHDFTTLLMNEDFVVVETQQPLRLPLDLQAEFHIKSDSCTIAYRKWLKQLGVTFGTV